MGRNRFFAVVVALALVAGGVAVGGMTPAGAAVTNVTVGSGDISLLPTPTTDWISNDEVSNNAGNVSFVSGPGTPPAGVGSAELGVTATSRTALAYANAPNVATRFDEIDALQYSTYRQSSDAGNLLAISLQFNVDFDKTDATNAFQGRVVFEPYFTAGSGNIPQNTWQTWTPLTGNWWMTSASPKVADATVPVACPQSSPCSWTALLAAYPDAGFWSSAPAVVFRAGVWPPGFVGNVDDFTFGVNGNSTVFDFEPTCTTDCYVATTGSDVGTTGTINDPFLTVQKGLDTVTAGGVVHVADGIYPTAVNTTINKAVTIQGQSRTGTILEGPRIQTDPAGSLAGLQITGTTSNVTMEYLTIRKFDYGIFTNGNVMTNVTIRHLDAVDNRVHGIWIQANVGSGINGLTVDDVDASGNNSLGGSSGRGLWVINGPKSNVAVTNSSFDNNGLVGVDLSDGSVTGATITGNTVSGNGDSGIGVLGALPGSATLVANNTVTNNGRYGIEIKNSTGDGTDSGANSVTVRDNVVSRTLASTDARDHGGIVVIRRGAAPAFQPSGIVIRNNTVTGYQRKPSGSTGDGFGIAVGGTGNVITKNSVSSNDVGIQVQGGNTANVQSTDFFDRDDAANGSASVTNNSIAGNVDIGLRIAGTGTAAATCNWWGAADGPGLPGGPGSGDGISVGPTYSPWLASSNLNGACGPPTITIGSLSIAEGSGTDPVAQVPVSLSSVYGGTVTVNYATADGPVGPNGAAQPNDYTSTFGTLTFLPGQQVKYIPVTVRGNLSVTQWDEYDENFTVNLSSPTNASLATSVGTVTILNDDTPTVSVSATPINTVEGNSGTHTVTVTATLSNPSVSTIGVSYGTTPGSAVAPSDYVAAAGTLSFLSGQTVKSFTVKVKGDTALEDYQFFSATISTPTGGASAVPVLGNAAQVVQILNDEKPNLTGTSITGSEGSTLVFGATLVQRYYLPISVAYTTVNGTAAAPGDFNAAVGNLSFPAGTSGTQTVGVVTKYDFTTEGVEKFSMTWTSASVKTSPITKTGTIKGNKT